MSVTAFPTVDSKDWTTLDGDDRLARIRAEIEEEHSPEDLIEQLVAASVQALVDQKGHKTVAFYDEELGNQRKRDFRRTCVVIGLDDEPLFNRFFNGRGGYRAMYWRGTDVGEAYNEAVVNKLISALLSHNKLARSPLADVIRDDRARNSLTHAKAKLWPFFEKRFVEGLSLDVERWRGPLNGNRIFDPAYPMFTIKGAFLDSSGVLEDVKVDRSIGLHQFGTT